MDRKHQGPGQAAQQPNQSNGRSGPSGRAARCYLGRCEFLRSCQKSGWKLQVCHREGRQEVRDQAAGRHPCQGN